MMLSSPNWDNIQRIKEHGCLAQLVERRPYKANVGGSIPSAPTRDFNPVSACLTGFFQKDIGCLHRILEKLHK